MGIASREMSTDSKMRSRSETNKIHAECPFSIIYLDNNSNLKTKQPKGKRTTRSTETDNSVVQGLQQQTFDFLDSNADVHYMVQPNEKWAGMTRYASFIRDDTRYSVGSFAKVANEQSVKRQCTDTEAESGQPILDWIARILEIRASDPLHVYARVAWMYWPYELPPGGSHHYGPREVAISDHMDIINVMSVTEPAVVKRASIAEEEEIGDAFHYRQAFNCRSRVLSELGE